MKNTRRIERLIANLVEATGGNEEVITKIIKEHNVHSWSRAHLLAIDMEAKMKQMMKDVNEELVTLKSMSSGLQGDDSDLAYSLRAKLAVKIGNKKGFINAMEKLASPIKKVTGRNRPPKKFN